MKLSGFVDHIYLRLQQISSFFNLISLSVRIRNDLSYVFVYIHKSEVFLEIMSYNQIFRLQGIKER
jgi:hypothetical protein